MKIFNYLSIAIYLLTSCNVFNGGEMPVTFIDTTKSFRKEIPIFKNGKYDFFYNLAKSKQKQLRLDSLENGFDNLQIRVWYELASETKERLVVITNKNPGWSATFYDMQINWDGKTQTILSKRITHVTPKTGWEFFTKNLLDLKIVTLPNADDIRDYDFGVDGSTITVEIATKKQYRFYSYWQPDANAGKVWQANNMVKILKLFKDELGVSNSY